MSNYRKEMLELVVELRNQRFRHLSRERRQRQAEVLEFIVTHPEGIAEIFKQQEEAENAR